MFLDTTVARTWVNGSNEMEMQMQMQLGYSLSIILSVLLYVFGEAGRYNEYFSLGKLCGVFQNMACVHDRFSRGM